MSFAAAPLATNPIDNKNELPVSVITTCYGRNRHLYNLLASLQTGNIRPAEVIIVNDDADKKRLKSFDLNIIQIPTSVQNSSETSLLDSGLNDNKKKLNNHLGFDIGVNRNIGAKQASFESLIFLDVDCIASKCFIEGLTHKLHQKPNALLMAQPRYLTRPLTEQEADVLVQTTFAARDDTWLDSISTLNPYRHNMVTDDNTKIEKSIEKSEDYGSFWSLCFAINQSQFKQIGGFDTKYMGYGAEDTDFAFTARQLKINFYLTSDVVYHQQHSVYRPPLNHLSSIAINANRFFEKWQHWPMAGWLEAFSQKGLIQWSNEQTEPITVLRLPTEEELDAAHYPDAPFV